MIEHNLVVYRLDELKEQVGDLQSDVRHLREDVAGLKVKAGLWGAVAGLLPALGVALLWLLK